MEIKLYSTNCPKCMVLKKKLEQKGISFELITDFDVEFIKSKGFMSAPILQVDDTFMKFEEANKWLKEADITTEECGACNL